MSSDPEERTRSMIVSRALPELYFEHFGVDTEPSPQPPLDDANRAPHIMSSNDTSAIRPALTSRSATHIAHHLDPSSLAHVEQPIHLATPERTTLGQLNTSGSIKPSGTVSQTGDSPISTTSTTLEQLVQDTENAFDDVTSALARMRVVRQSFGTIPSTPPTPPPRDPARLLRAEMNCCNATKAPLYRRKATKGITRQRSQKTQRSRKSYQQHGSQRKATLPAQTLSEKDGGRWGLKGSVSDLFSMRMFQKIEADEVVTPGQIEAFKVRKRVMAQYEQEEQEREREQARSRCSLDSMLLDELLGHGATPDPEDTPPLVDSDSSIYSSDEQAWNEDIDATTETAGHGDSSVNVVGDEDGFTFLEDKTPSARNSPVSFLPEDLPPLPPPPPPPAKNARRPLLSKKPTPLLPPLTEDCEVSVTSPTSATSACSGEFVFLRSTPCTLTAPNIRHGPIRFSKCVVPQQAIMESDDGLDWTAFQMAVRGGVGDWFSESGEATRRREAEETKEIEAWWTSWDFESAGELLSEDREDPEPSLFASSSSIRGSLDSGERTDSSASLSDGSSEHDEDEDEDELSDSLAAYSLSPSNTYSAHHKWNRLSQQTRNPSPARFETDTSKQAIALDEANSEDVESGLHVVPNSSNDAIDFVPMSCNLTSDLGDFLRWEAEHAYASIY
ncbi:hypothetical protein Micbo1qcDRAFT_195531 [Microdochium bolleyi]|uniref:Uncharacterized protein n=1 Tax=Microdochium bolleyi TaxID=196109 RepID=A0A136J2P8_9PEZI|nr:hypothetical protein Micbo1qcDRAFT_195531 [Microdochium bolleyi]